MYDDHCRMVLQMIMNEGAVLEDRVTEFVVKIFDRNISLKNVITSINLELSSIMMMVKSSTCEVYGTTYYMLTSLINDDMAKFQTEFLQGQLELLRKVFLDIISTSQCFISSTRSLNLITNLDNKITKVAGETFLKSMVERKWLSYKSGQYYIGPRSTAELIPYFKEACDNLNNCMLCKQVIFYGRHCNHCQKKAHELCLQTYDADQNDPNELVCPQCGEGMKELDESLPENVFAQHLDESSGQMVNTTIEESIVEPTRRSKRLRI